MSLNRISLAKKIVSEVQKEVKSRHYIISEFEFPFFFLDEKEKYEKQFGKEKFAELLAFDQKRLEIRKLIAMEIPDLNLISDMIATEIAAAQCGVGECGEQVYYAMAKFLMKDFQEDVTIVLLKSFFNNRTYNHAFIVLGNEFNFSKIEEFKSLSDEFILVDPKLGVVCQLNKALESESLFKKYLEIYQLEIRDMVLSLNIKQKEMLLKIVAKATEASQKVKKKLGIGIIPIEAKKVVTPTFSLSSDGVPIQTELNRITGKEWKYYPPKASNIPKALFTSLDQAEVVAVIKSLKQQGVAAKKQIIKGDPIKHVAVIDEPKLDQLRKMERAAPEQSQAGLFERRSAPQ